MNNMTGDPNQENRPSVFGFEPYPSLNTQPIDWSRIPIQSLSTSGQFGAQNYDFGDLNNFSFCTNETPNPAQFPFSQNSDCNGLRSMPFNIRCKRKTDSPSLQASKQHITEEKMAFQMSRLHISSETASCSKESDTDRTRRLYMCEEMRKLQSDTILPQSLLSKIQRPCTALVLWTPPKRLLPLGNDNGNNNDEEVPDHNQVTAENSMDLDNI